MTAKYKSKRITPDGVHSPVLVVLYASGERAAYGYPFESLSRGLGDYSPQLQTEQTNWSGISVLPRFNKFGKLVGYCYINTAKWSAGWVTLPLGTAWKAVTSLFCHRHINWLR